MEPFHTGQRLFRLHFYHANYPEGVRDKAYVLQTVERGQRFILARSAEHEMIRLLYIHDIDWDWLKRHFPGRAAGRDGDIQAWLSRNV